MKKPLRKPLKKKPARLRLGPGHRVNPWMKRVLPAADLVVAAMSSARVSSAALLTLARVMGVAGICHTCGCTDEAGCPEGCYWTTPKRTRCSTCSEPPLKPRVKDRRRTRPIPLIS